MNTLQRWSLALALAIGVTGCASTQSNLKVFNHVEQADRAYEQGQWREAEQQYLAVIEQVPNDAYAWFRLGNVYMRQERLTNAIAMYREALQRDPDQAKPYFNMATVYLLEAHKALQQAQQRLPTHQQAQLTERIQNLEGLLYGTTNAAPVPVQQTRTPQAPPPRVQPMDSRDPLGSELSFTVPNSRQSGGYQE